MAEAYIIDAVRTPRGIGKLGKGALAAEHPQHLARNRAEAALAERNNLDTATVDDVHLGHFDASAARRRGDMGRMAALDAGYDITCIGRHARPLLRRRASPRSRSAAAQIMSGMEDLRHRGRHRNDELHVRHRRSRKTPPMMDAGNAAST